MAGFSSPAELVAELHRRQNEMYSGGPVDRVAELLAEEIVWHVPGSSPIAGDHRGVAAVIAYFKQRRRLADATMKMEPGELLEADDAVAQFVAGSAMLDGEPVSWQTVGVYRLDLDPGRIHEVWLVPLDSALFDRIWSSF
jgi:uncharacterized protein